MDDRNNTIAGWVLFGGIAALGLSIVTGMYFAPHRPHQMGFVVEGVEVEGGEGGGAEAEKPIAFYLQTASAARGEAQFKKCAACHNAEKGGPNALGPNLWGVVGDHIAAGRGGFPFSDALKSKGGTWDWDNLSEWLKSPKAYANGAKMTFAGLGNVQDRANLIAWLNTQGSNVPLPAAPAAAAAPADAGAAKGGGEGATAPNAANQTNPSAAGAAAQPAPGTAGAPGGTKSNEGVETTTGPK